MPSFSELLDKDLFGKGQKVKTKIDLLNQKLEEKLQKYKRSIEDLAKHKKSINDQIDAFFEKVLERVNNRKETLKNEYKQIEQKERRRLKTKQMKMEKDLAEFRKFIEEFSDFFSDFDYEMDFLANKATFETYLQDLSQIEQELKKPLFFLTASQFKYP